MHNRAIFDQIGRGGHTLQRWENDLLVGCAASSIGSQSCANRPDVGLESGDDLWSRPTLCNRSAVCRSSDARRPIIARSSADDYRGHRPIPYWLGGASSRQSVDRCPVDVHDGRAGITRLPADGSMIEKIGRVSEKNLTWPDGTPIASWRRRWPANNPIIIRSSPKNDSFCPKTIGSASEPLCDIGIRYRWKSTCLIQI